MLVKELPWKSETGVIVLDAPFQFAVAEARISLHARD